jgi:hypothetical protein
MILRNKKIKKMTIAQQLKIKEFPFEIKDKNGKEIYYEESNGFWWKREYDSNGKEIYYETSKGFWCKKEYDSNGKEIYCETSKGFWYKKEYDSNGNEIYYEDSSGYVKDNRPKHNKLTPDQIIEQLESLNPQQIIEVITKLIEQCHN